MRLKQPRQRIWPSFVPIEAMSMVLIRFGRSVTAIEAIYALYAADRDIFGPTRTAGHDPSAGRGTRPTTLTRRASMPECA